MKKLASLIFVLMLTACVKTTTAAPKVSRADLEAERRAQQELAMQMKGQQYGETAKITPEMAKDFKTVANRVGVAGEDLCRDIRAKNCSFGFVLEESKDLNAYADGKNIVVSSAMANFADFDELANVLSHEYAHNVMQHVAAQQKNVGAGALGGMLIDVLAASQGVDTGGTGSKLGGSLAGMHYSQDYEREADYVGLYIMERAGFDISKAPNLWRKMSIANSSSIADKGRYGSTHPSNPERFVALNQTIQEINYKKQNNLPLVPEFRKK